jgi:hypothetical protein
VQQKLPGMRRDSLVSAFMTRKHTYFYPRLFDTLQTQILRSRGFDAYVPAVLSSKCTFRVNEVIRIANLKTKKEVIEKGLKELLRIKNRELLRQEPGTVDIDLSLEELASSVVI